VYIFFIIFHQILLLCQCLYPSLPALIRQGIFWNKEPEQPVDNFVDILLAKAFRHARGVPTPNGTLHATKNIYIIQ
jgi:hypothetical protein